MVLEDCVELYGCLAKLLLSLIMSIVPTLCVFTYCDEKNKVVFDFEGLKKGALLEHFDPKEESNEAKPSRERRTNKVDG